MPDQYGTLVFTPSKETGVGPAGGAIQSGTAATIETQQVLDGAAPVTVTYRWSRDPTKTPAQI